ncbi:hemerythrin domain-containing protein [Streptomyces sp. NBC_01351]|uniref:hemerythrin domain-containing protein n=1 Tax=Streptomyces sp. NBC_01351 TaxID=2903833 RepID=UPI002E33281B|nr:hemerythrin domain-containing protein [Streptomyces sp. NBC_01351]
MRRPHPVTGLGLLKKALHAHHSAEDEALWPVLRDALAGRSGDLALLEAMEAEHTALDPLVRAVDDATAAARTCSGGGPDLVGDLVDSFVTGLGGHLHHEEAAALPLAQEVLTPDQWTRFDRVHAQWIEADAAEILPWLLDGADPWTTTAMLTPLPTPTRRAYEQYWQPAYAALARWHTPVSA